MIIERQVTNRKLGHGFLEGASAGGKTCSGDLRGRRSARAGKRVASSFPRAWAAELKSLGAQEVDQVSYAAGIAPLIVVPRDHLHAVAAYHQRHGRIHNR